MLAIERDHSDAKRLSQWDRLMSESRRARGRYEDQGHWLTRGRFTLEGFRAWRSRRVLWLRFLRAARAQPGQTLPWSRFLAAGHVSLPAMHVVMTQLPWLGVRVSGGSIDSDVDWLNAGVP